MLIFSKKYKKSEICGFGLLEIHPPRSGEWITIIEFQKRTKKLKFMALLKQKLYFVPRGTNVENFFEP